MASSSSKPLFSDGYPPVSNEEFNLFHTLDRKLFTRLVFNLGRDPAESTQVMALWMWLEKKGKEIYLVNKLLHTLPDVLLNVMADESVMVLNCIGSDDFPYSSSLEPEIPVIQSTTKTDVTLKFFHEHRLGILRGVTDLFNQVCLRAFQDILHPEYMINTQGGPPSQNVGGNFIYNPMFPFVFHDPSGVVPGFTQYHHPQGVGVPHGVFPQYFPPHQHQHQPQPQPHILAAGGSSSSNVGGFFPRATFDPYDLAVQRQIMNNEIGDLFSRMQLKDDTSNVDRETQTAADQEVPIDDRTIFLTFSKGYPISENEINEFFNG